jgi:hypothetical protein
MLVRRRIVFNIAILVFKCLHGTAPRYLSDHCVPISSIAGRRHLRSAKMKLLRVPPSRAAVGCRSFAVSFPSFWYSLPLELQAYEFSIFGFRWSWKRTCLMCNWYRSPFEVYFNYLSLKKCSYNNNNNNNNRIFISALVRLFTTVQRSRFSWLFWYFSWFGLARHSMLCF